MKQTGKRKRTNNKAQTIVIELNAKKEIRVFDEMLSQIPSRERTAFMIEHGYPLIIVETDRSGNIVRRAEHNLENRAELSDYAIEAFARAMDQLVESVKERGVITPVTLRKKEDGRYETVSGHRRIKACELAGLETVPAEIKELTRDEAILLMVDSNLQRSFILPSEKAMAYRMRLDAIRRMPGRPVKQAINSSGDGFGPLIILSHTALVAGSEL